MDDQHLDDHSGQTSLTALTLAERVALLSGADTSHTEAVEHAGVPAIEVGDGPHGVRKETGVAMRWYPATCFPTAYALGSSWDRSLLRDIGEALGAEARAAAYKCCSGPAST